MIILLLSSCTNSVVGNSIPPSGEEVFVAFLSNLNQDLKDESLCRANILLYEQLALSLSVSHESKNTTVISSTCTPSKHEMNTKVIDIWDCTIQINENNPDGEFISSSTYVFGLSKDKKEYIGNSLRCH